MQRTQYALGGSVHGGDRLDWQLALVAVVQVAVIRVAVVQCGSCTRWQLS